MSPLTKTPAEWCAELGVEILDPDGWRYDRMPIDTPLTLEEFKRRASMCTLKGGFKALTES